MPFPAGWIPRTVELTFLTGACSFEESEPSMVTIRTYTLWPTAIGREIWRRLTQESRVMDNVWLVENLAAFGYIERIESTEHRRVCVPRTSEIEIALQKAPSVPINDVDIVGWEK